MRGTWDADLPFAEGEGGGKVAKPSRHHVPTLPLPEAGPAIRRLSQNAPPPFLNRKASSFPPTPQRFLAQSRGTSVAHLHAVRGKTKMSREDARMMRSRREMDEGRERAAHGT